MTFQTLTVRFRKLYTKTFWTWNFASGRCEPDLHLKFRTRSFRTRTFCTGMLPLLLTGSALCTDLSLFALSIMGYSQFWLYMADKEIKLHRRVIRMIVPMIHRAKNDRSVRRAQPVYDNTMGMLRTRKLCMWTFQTWTFRIRTLILRRFALESFAYRFPALRYIAPGPNAGGRCGPGHFAPRLFIPGYFEPGCYASWCFAPVTFRARTIWSLYMAIPSRTFYIHRHFERGCFSRGSFARGGFALGRFASGYFAHIPASFALGISRPGRFASGLLVPGHFALGSFRFPTNWCLHKRTLWTWRFATIQFWPRPRCSVLGTALHASGRTFRTWNVSGLHVLNATINWPPTFTHVDVSDPTHADVGYTGCPKKRGPF